MVPLGISADSLGAFALGNGIPLDGVAGKGEGGDGATDKYEGG